MKKIYTLFLGLNFAAAGFTQTTAMDFDILDCAASSPHHLFEDLDAGKAVIVEFFMNACTPCVTAGGVLEEMKTTLESEFPGMIKSYAFAFNNTTPCSVVNTWISTNSFTSIPSDSGATQVAYYGGMGMPTIVILGGGTEHLVLGAAYTGFSTSDTTIMADDIRNHFTELGFEEEFNVSEFTVFPNPAKGNAANISFTLSESSDVLLELFDLTGRRVSVVFNEKSISGEIKRAIDLSGLVDGSYLLRLNVNGEMTTHKLAVSR